MARSQTVGSAIGDSIRSARNAAGLRQEDLARKVEIGTSTLRDIEAGTKKGTSVITVLRLLAVLGQGVEVLGVPLDLVKRDLD